MGDHESQDPRWLHWAKRLQAAAQNGLAYSENPFDIERYRSVLRVAAEIMTDHTDASMPHVSDLFAAQVGHATPKVDVRGVVFRDESILLVRERSDGRWSLPGGWADLYDSPAEATVREIFEESGYRTRVTRLLALYDRAKHEHPPMPFHVYKVFFECELIGGEASTSVETDEVGFFAEQALPELSIGRVTTRQIARFYSLHRDPSAPTDFE